VARRRSSAFLKHPDPPFPRDHDEEAASLFISGSGPACGCWVCQTVTLPRQRGAKAKAAAEAERAEVSAGPVKIVYLSEKLRAALGAEAEGGRLGVGLEAECGVCEEDEFTDALEPEGEC
jgi:hypothetical protein